MTYAEMVRALYESSGLRINEFAERMHFSPVQLSRIINEHQEATEKMFFAALSAASLTHEQVLIAPAAGERARIERRMLELFRTLTPGQAEVVIAVMDQMRVPASKKKKPSGKQSA